MLTAVALATVLRTQAAPGLGFCDSQQTADAAAKAFGVPAAFGSALKLIRAPDNDLMRIAISD